MKWAYTKNNLVSEIWSIGQLKNKDLYGEEILTQTSVGESTTSHNNGDESEDEAPPVDDDDSCTEMSEHTTGSQSTTNDEAAGGTSDAYEMPASRKSKLQSMRSMRPSTSFH